LWEGKLKTFHVPAEGAEEVRPCGARGPRVVRRLM
jgi:hypothetical protein